MTDILQLSDLAFQRHILVQALMLLEFLLSFTEKAKKKLAARAQQQRGVPKSQYALSDQDVSSPASNIEKVLTRL